MTDAVSDLAATWAVIGERLGDYVHVWREAVERNGNEDYAADDFLVDLQTLWGMSVRDVARFGVAVVDAAGPLLAGFRDDPPPAPDDGRGDAG
jgi:hypothetical protein